MALIWNDRVLETTTTTGTGAIALAAAVTGYQRFADAMSTSDTCYYFIEAKDANGNPSGDWETGLGTYSGANTLTRTTVHQSSNADTAVNFGAGTKYVALTATAAFFNIAGYTDEQARDAIGAALTDTGLVVVTVNDGADTIDINVPAAVASDVRTGTDTAKALTAGGLSDASAPQTLNDIAITNWNMASGFNAKWTLGGNRTLTVSNPKAGWTYSLAVIQDGTGNRTVTWPSSFDWGGTGAPTLSATANKRDRITLFCTDAATPKFDAFLSGKGFS